MIKRSLGWEEGTDSGNFCSRIGKKIESSAATSSEATGIETGP